MRSKTMAMTMSGVVIGTLLLALSPDPAAARFAGGARAGGGFRGGGIAAGRVAVGGYRGGVGGYRGGAIAGRGGWALGSIYGRPGVGWGGGWRPGYGWAGGSRPGYGFGGRWGWPIAAGLAAGAAYGYGGYGYGGYGYPYDYSDYNQCQTWNGYYWVNSCYQNYSNSWSW